MKKFFSKILAGFVIGAGAIIPGLSGGILAVSMGLYQPMIEAVTGLFKAPKKNFTFLLPLGIGGVVGFAIFMFLIDKLFVDFRTAIICLFLGLVVGSIPSFIKEANNGMPFRKSNISFSAIGFVCALALIILGLPSGDAAVGVSREITPLLSAMCGGVIVIGTVIPGVSTSFVLINMNVYDSFMKLFTQFFNDVSHNIVLVLFAVLGMAVVAIPLLLLVRKLLAKFHCQSFYAIFGILLATMAGCIIQEISIYGATFTPVKLLIYVALFAVGLVASYFMDKAMQSLELKDKDPTTNLATDE